jgi:hypothetical protein
MELQNNDEQLTLAIADLKSQDTPNYNATAKKYGVARTTLRRRFKGETVSIQQHHAEKLQCLNNIQEEILIEQINKLTRLGCPPTPQITKNLAEAIIGRPVGKNWHAGFIRRHKNRLYSLYLHNIDSDRQKAEYKPMFKHYFELVSAF